MAAIYRRELRSFFVTINGYLFIFFMLLMVGVYAAIIHFDNGYAGFESTLYSVRFLFLIMIPLLTMRSLAEEKRQRTDQLLFSLPIALGRVVLAKFFAAATILAIPCLVFLAYPLVFRLFGENNIPIALASLLGFFLLGAALIAIGVFVSSLSENQIAAAIGSFGAMILVYILPGLASSIPADAHISAIAFAALAALTAALVYGSTGSKAFSLALVLIAEGGIAALYVLKETAFENAFPNLLRSLSLFDRMTMFVSGIFDLSAVFYLLSVAAVFLFFTAQVLERRRWR